MWICESLFSCQHHWPGLGVAGKSMRAEEKREIKIMSYRLGFGVQLTTQRTTYDSVYNLWFGRQHMIQCRTFGNWYWLCVNFCFGVQLLFWRGAWVLAYNLGFGIQLTTQNTPTLRIVISLSSNLNPKVLFNEKQFLSGPKVCVPWNVTYRTHREYHIDLLVF